MPDLRLFYAVDLPEPSAADLDRVRVALAPGSGRAVRWLDTHGLHGTLSFLGRTPEPLVESLAALLHAAARGVHAIPTVLAPLTAFPAPRRARVLVVPLTDPSGMLATIAERLQDGASSLGFPREDRAFRPHVTLARIKNPFDVRALLALAPKLQTPLVLDRVVLYRSELGPGGSRYHPVATVALPRPER